MFEEILFFVSLLLALYGLANIITSLALWLTAPVKGKPYRMIIVLKPGENIRATVVSARERLSGCGLSRSTVLCAVDGGLDEEKKKKAAAYCSAEGIPFGNGEEAMGILEIPSFQTPENQV